MSIVLNVLAIIPGLLICYYIYRRDKYEREARLPLVISFLLGMIITIPVMGIQSLAHSYGWDDPSSIGLTLFFSFIVVSLSEELLKFIALLVYPFTRPFFNEPIDGIVYAVMIGMGFATLENILYANRYGLSTTVLRAFTAVPAHAVFAIIIGFYAGKAKFDPENKFRLLITGLLIAIGIHGLYDFFIIQEVYEGLMILAVFTLGISIYFAQNLIKVHEENSPFKDNEADLEPPGEQSSNPFT